MKYSNITTVQKKGSSLILKNQRGLNRVSVIRSIFMRMLYNIQYPSIDLNISDMQMGGRKNKGCRNNLFIINGLIHDSLKCKNSKPICLQIYDYSQMFDSINLQQALIDLFYNCGVSDQTFSLLYEANKDIKMSVKTPFGLTDRQTVKSTVLQGETWGSLPASNQVDSIARECEKGGYNYKYKGELNLTSLGFVDDYMGITEANHSAQQMNVVFNVRTAEKSLQFGEKKCKGCLWENVKQ